MARRTSSQRAPKRPNSGRSRRTKRPRSRFRQIAVPLGVVLVVAALALTAYQAVAARRELRESAAQLRLLGRALEANDVSAARRVATSAHEAAFNAHRHTSGPVWWGASYLPFLGDDVTAVRTVADVAADVTGAALGEVMDAATSLSPSSLGLTEGRVELAPIRDAAPALATAAASTEDAAARLDTLERGGLLTPIAAALDDVIARVETARDLTRRAAAAAALAPTMLGGDGPRTYLAIFQNNAELRTTGGIPGAYAVITARDGKLTMGEQGGREGFGRYDEPVLPLTDAETAIYGKQLGLFPQATNLAPEFTRTAQLLAEMYRRENGVRVDGVISVDPVAMGYLLRGTGPVPVPGRFDGRPLTPVNAAAVLLRDIYLTEQVESVQNDVFNESARAIFDAATSTQVQPRGLVNALVQSAVERRMLLWSANKREQAALDGLTIAGQIDQEPSVRPSVAVFLNDSVSDKMSYYLDYAVNVTPTSCGSAGNQVIDVAVRLTSTVPKGRRFPPSVAGYFPTGLPNGAMKHTVYVYSPVEGRVEAVRSGDGKAVMATNTDGTREVGSVAVQLAPGQTRTLTFTLRTGRDQVGDVDLQTTPAAITTGQGAVAPSAC